MKESIGEPSKKCRAPLEVIIVADPSLDEDRTKIAVWTDHPPQSWRPSVKLFKETTTRYIDGQLPGPQRPSSQGRSEQAVIHIASWAEFPEAGSAK